MEPAPENAFIKEMRSGFAGVLHEISSLNTSHASMRKEIAGLRKEVASLGNRTGHVMEVALR
jgi:hypothetical protein